MSYGAGVNANKTITLDGNIRQMDYGHHPAYSILAGYRMAFEFGCP